MSSWLLFATLVAIVWTVRTVSGKPDFKPFFKYLPEPLWCYFLPTLLSTVGWIPPDSGLYGALSRKLLPACLILMLIGTDLPAMVRLSPKAVTAMLLGSAGIGAGCVFTYLLLFKSSIFPGASALAEPWEGWGCLAATWTGGSANMVAVKEILQTPEQLFSNLVIVDTIVAYSWMALLVYASKYQTSLDRWLKADSATREPAEMPPEPAGLSDPIISDENNIYGWLKKLALVCLAFALGELCAYLAGFFPDKSGALNKFTWTVIFATAIPLALSLTPAHKAESHGAGTAGSFLLYLLLTTIGARADFSALISAPWLVLAGFVWVTVHGLVLISAGKMFRIPSAILAAASQANVGGTVSAPLVASLYNRKYASLGLLLAVLGNIYGTYAGLLASEICRWAGNLI